MATKHQTLPVFLSPSDPPLLGHGPFPWNFHLFWVPTPPQRFYPRLSLGTGVLGRPPLLDLGGIFACLLPQTRELSPRWVRYGRRSAFISPFFRVFPNRPPCNSTPPSPSLQTVPFFFPFCSFFRRVNPCLQKENQFHLNWFSPLLLLFPTRWLLLLFL